MLKPSDFSIQELRGLFLTLSIIKAILAAVANIWFFYYLNGQPVKTSTIPQSWVSTISTTFVLVFRICLGISLGITYTQRTWRGYRERPLDLETIEILHSVLQNPLDAFGLINTLPTEFLFTLGCFAIPLGLILVPGSITVAPQEQTITALFDVPTFDPSYKEPKIPTITRSINVCWNGGNNIPITLRHYKLHLVMSLTHHCLHKLYFEVIIYIYRCVR